MLVLYYSLLIVCIYLGLGLGLTILFCPKTLRKYIPLLAPLIGYCYLTLACWYCYKLKVGGTDVYAIPILVLPSLLLLFLLLKNKTKSINKLRSFLQDKNLLTAYCISLIGFLIISLPLFSNEQGLNSIVMGNLDPAYYSIISKYLKEFPHSGVSGFFAQQESVLKWHIEKSVFGAFISTSFSASLLSLEVYQIQSITINIFFAFSIAIIYAIARQLFQYNYWGASAVTALYAINPIIYYTIYNGFQSQIIAVSLSLGLLLLNIEALHSCQRLSDYYKYIPLAVLLNWGMSLTYPHMLLLLYGPMFLYLLWYSLQKKEWQTFINAIFFVLISILIMSVLSFQRFIGLINYLFVMNKANAGWWVSFIMPSEIVTGFQDKTNDYEVLVVAIFSILAIVLFYMGFLQSRKSDLRVYMLACSLSITIYIAHIILSLKNLASFDEFGGYKAYKLLSFFVPQLLLAFLLVFRNLRAKLSIKLLIFFTVLMLTLLGTYNLLLRISTSYLSVTLPMIELRKVESNTAIKSINIKLNDNWETIWSPYFLGRKDLYFKRQVYHKNPSGSRLKGEWDLLNSDTSNKLKLPEVLQLSGLGIEPSDPIVINSSYKLEKVEDDFYALLDKGWHSSEKTHIWSGKAHSKSAVITMNSLKNNLYIDVQLRYSPLKTEDRLSVHLNTKKVTDCPSNEFCIAKNLFLKKGKNYLEFRSVLLPNSPSKEDSRTLSYAFSSIKITPSNPNVLKSKKPLDISDN